MASKHPQRVSEPPQDPLAWTVWPAARNWPLSLGVACFILGLSAGALISFSSAWYAFITLAVLTMATASHYFPTHYRLTSDELEVRAPLQQVKRPWSAFRAVFDEGDRLILSPISNPRSPLVRRRGVTLMLGEGAELVRQYVATNMASQEPTAARKIADRHD